MKTNSPKVTIVTVTYNLLKAGRAETIKQCIESVHSQSYGNIEYIIIDGASNDGTLELLDEYRLKGWLEIFSAKDTGIYEAMNKGISYAHGKYITYLNSDDYYCNPQGIEFSINALEASNADFSYAPVIMVNGKDEPYLRKHTHKNPSLYDTFILMPFSHQSMVMKVDLMNKMNGFNIKYKSAGDYDLVIRLALSNAKAIKVETPFVTYRQAGLSYFNQDLSRRETISIFFEHYAPYANITLEECNNIFYEGYKGIPARFALKLSELKLYFNLCDYIKIQGDRIIELEKTLSIFKKHKIPSTYFRGLLILKRIAGIFIKK